MTTTDSVAERTHRAAKRYIYAFGGRPRRRQRDDARSPRRQGRRPGGDDQRGPARPARLHHHDRGLQRLLRRRRAAARRPVGRRPGRRARRSSGRPARASATRRQPAAGECPVRRQVLDARHDGHGAQPGPQRGRRCTGLDRPDRQRALRLGRLPALHPDVRPDRHGRRRRAASTQALDAAKAARGAQQDTDLDAAALRELVGAFKAIVRGTTGREFPTDPHEQLDLAIKAVFALAGSASARHDYREYNKIPHDLGTAVNVVTMVFGNMGDDSGHRRGLHARPEHRREGALRRVPDQRPGRGRRGRHPHAPGDRQLREEHAGGRTASSRTIAENARAPLPRRAGPGVHHRARPPLHAPDAHRASAPPRPP